MCLGALDGKRILMKKPPNSGSTFYDYRGHFNVIMMALVDADCKFCMWMLVLEGEQVIVVCGTVALLSRQ